MKTKENKTMGQPFANDWQDELKNEMENKQMEHTPAPWFVGKTCKTDVYTSNPDIVISQSRYLGSEVPKEEFLANACLIAAAPELLDGAKSIMDYLEKHGDANTLATARLCLRDPIAKAEGRL